MPPERLVLGEMQGIEVQSIYKRQTHGVAKTNPKAHLCLQCSRAGQVPEADFGLRRNAISRCQAKDKFQCLRSRSVRTIDRFLGKVSTVGA